MHTARIWMASATPGGAPGYDYDKEFGNNIAHSRARTSQRLRGYTARSLEVKEGRHRRDFDSLTVFRAFGEWEFYAAAMRTHCLDVNPG